MRTGVLENVPVGCLEGSQAPAGMTGPGGVVAQREHFGAMAHGLREIRTTLCVLPWQGRGGRGLQGGRNSKKHP